MRELSFTFHSLHPQQHHCALGFRRESFVAPELTFLFLSFFVCQVLERCRLQKQLSSCPKAPVSDVEHSGESDTVPQSDGGPAEEDDVTSQSAGKEKPVKERDLQAQVRVQHKLLWRICVVARHALGIKSLAKALKIPASLHSPV